MSREEYVHKEKVDEILSYAKASNFRDYLILRLLWVTGVRISECLEIHPRDIYYEMRCINVPNLKHVGNRLVYFDEKTEEDLKRYINDFGIRREGLLFVIGRIQAFKIVKKYGRIAGVSISPHTLRHSFATFAEESGMKFNTLQRLLGHDPQTLSTQVYLHAGGIELQKEYSTLDFS
jgi:integrase/recombinase XerD